MRLSHKDETAVPALLWRALIQLTSLMLRFLCIYSA